MAYVVAEFEAPILRVPPFDRPGHNTDTGWYLFRQVHGHLRDQYMRPARGRD